MGASLSHSLIVFESEFDRNRREQEKIDEKRGEKKKANQENAIWDSSVTIIITSQCVLRRKK